MGRYLDALPTDRQKTEKSNNRALAQAIAFAVEKAIEDERKTIIEAMIDAVNKAAQRAKALSDLAEQDAKLLD